MQPSFFDQDRVLDKLDKLDDPLRKIDELVNWEGFRLTLEEIRPEYDKQKGGRPPLDVVMMFKMIFLRHYYDLSHKQAEYQVLDRLSFRRFLGLNFEESVPDTNTVWVYEERLKEKELIKPLFVDLMLQIENAGYLPRGGQIIDATIVEAPRRKNAPDDGDDSDGGSGGLTDAQRRQANQDAHWTKKHGKSYFGYKDHINIDNKHKLIRCWDVTPANRHDGHILAGILDRNKPRNKPMPKHMERANQRKSRIRSRVEHACGGIKQGTTRQFVKCNGLGRATFRIGMKNMVYNVKRLGWLVNHVSPMYSTG